MYMSPERLQTESYGKDSDIWSLGMMLLECLAGDHPLQVYVMILIKDAKI